MEENNFNQNTQYGNTTPANTPEVNEQLENQSEIPETNEYLKNQPKTFSPEPADKQPKSTGPIIGIAIIVVILIFGGLYYWGAQINKQTQENGTLTAEIIENQEDTSIEQLKVQSSSDEIADIETDLNATDLEGLDQELEDIDQELNF